VLFRHGLHPLRPGATLRVGQWRAIWDDLVVLMGEGVVANRIDTVRPEHTPEAMGREPRVDDHGGEVYVYRRTSQPCLVCGSTVRTEVLAGRNVFWCARCQPRFRSRAVQSSPPPARGSRT
jgi:endonuclease-8